MRKFFALAALFVSTCGYSYDAGSEATLSTIETTVLLALCGLIMLIVLAAVLWLYLLPLPKPRKLV